MKHLTWYVSVGLLSSGFTGLLFVINPEISIGHILAVVIPLVLGFGLLNFNKN